MRAAQPARAPGAQQPRKQQTQYARRGSGAVALATQTVWGNQGSAQKGGESGGGRAEQMLDVLVVLSVEPVVCVFNAYTHQYSLNLAYQARIVVKPR